MSMYKNKAFLTGIIAGGLHFLLCIFVFFMVQISNDGQAGFAWFFMFDLDYPTAEIAFNLLGRTTTMLYIIDWWWSVSYNQGPNIRALLLFGIFGTLHWFLIGFSIFKIFSFLKSKLWFKTGVKSG